jgi:hypothetical protein
MRTKLWLALPIFIASTALAQGPGLHTAKGEGAAKNEEGRVGQFRFDVKKRVRQNGTSEVGGQLTFRIELPATANDPARLVTINMPQARVYGSVEKVAEFAGPGLIEIKTRQNTARFQGKVSSRVEDNRRPTDPNWEHPDLFRIHFEFADSDRFYHFEGKVGRGDIVVAHRQ